MTRGSLPEKARAAETPSAKIESAIRPVEIASFIGIDASVAEIATDRLRKSITLDRVKIKSLHRNGIRPWMLQRHMSRKTSRTAVR